MYSVYNSNRKVNHPVINISSIITGYNLHKKAHKRTDDRA